VIECVPTLRSLVVNVAWPTPFNVPVPNVVPPSLKNVTVPVGGPAPGVTALTAAVNVTAWPSTDGLADDATVVVVKAWLTVWVRVGDVLPWKLPFPL